MKIIVPEKKLVKNILEWYVDPSKTFSQYTWSDMQEQFSLEDPITGNILPKIHDVNQDCVDNVLTQWEKFRSKIKSFPGNNESECTHYIAVMLDSLPNVDNVRLALEYRVTDTVITGYLDYAFVTSKGLFSSVISVIEAKHVGIVKGRAQNYVQLLACYDLARKSYCKCMADHKIPSVLEKQLLEEFPLCIYGVISTVTEWVFVRFDGKEWLETNVIFIKPNFEDDREHVEKVLTIMYSILVYQSACVKALCF